MRVTFFLGKLSGGGAERVVCNLANFLAKKGHLVDLMTLDESEPVEELISGITQIPLYKKIENNGKIQKTIKRTIRLYRYMKKTKVDAYVVMLPITTIMMLLFSGITRVPIVAAERVDPKAYRGVKKFLLQRLAHRAKGWVFQTEEIQRWYEPWLKSAKKVVIPNAINPLFLIPICAEKRQDEIVAVGRLTSQKNFQLLIKSFANISAEFPECSLKIYGTGPLLSELQNLATALGISDRVKFPGYVTDMPEKLKSARMFVMSSDFEGMPNALMEAMALGLPCVSTDCSGGGARFLIENDVNGFLVPVNDIEAMTKALHKILATPKKAEQLGNEAYKIRERLSPEVIYAEWERFVFDIV